MAVIDAKIPAESEIPNDTLVQQKTRAAMAVRNVLFATDFSSTSEAALPYATAIGRHFGSTLHAAHVLSDAGLLMMTGGVDYVSMGTLYEDAQAEAKEKLDRLAPLLEGIPHRCHVGHGQVWKNLAAIVDENGIDLIVVGTHGRGGLGKLLLGSVAEDILRHAPCPVLTIGPRVSGRTRLPAMRAVACDLAPVELDLRQIVYATNFAENAARVAQSATGLAQEFGAQLTLMHVMENYPSLGRRVGPGEDGVRQLQRLIPEDAELQYEPQTVLEFGPPAQCILKVAEEREADMIVLGARTAAEVGTTHWPWSTAHYVIAQARCPVLTIRG